jgi:2-keto-4-pentenoate hydratase/2-oxohepta-3-ene-1,7-dioic acid hydratase in catechol pathway
MKIVRFQEGSAIAHGILREEKIEVLDGCPFEQIRPANRSIPLEKVKLLAPVSPPNILAVGLNYRQHAVESNLPMPERPLMFLKATSSVIGPGDPILLPGIAPDEVDFEAELCVVIGAKARHVSEAEALKYVFGYTCGNDVSARNVQLKEDAQWARGKSFDTFCPLGPWVETELNPDKAAIGLRVNGRTMQESNTSDLIFTCARIVSFLSRCLTLLPGTVIMTGTPAGVGFARKPPLFLRPGDVVEVHIAGIGVLRNPVAAE